MSDHCLTCGGLIAEEGKAYGYAGKFCYCEVPPKTQRPAKGVYMEGGTVKRVTIILEMDQEEITLENIQEYLQELIANGDLSWEEK